MGSNFSGTKLLFLINYQVATKLGLENVYFTQRVNNNEVKSEVNMDSVYMLTSSIYKINNKELEKVKNEDGHQMSTVISPDKLSSNDDKVGLIYFVHYFIVLLKEAAKIDKELCLF